MYVDLIRRDHDPLLLFFLDDTFGSVADHLPETLGWELSTSLNTILSNSAEQKVPKYSLASLGKVFYHLGNYQECRTAFRLMLRQYGPSEIAYYYLAACCEIEGDFRDSLAFYRKALRLEDSEDTRTGICRVSASLREHSGKTPQVSADQQSPSAELQ